MYRILVIEDDPNLNQNIKDAFIAEQMHVEVAYDGLIAERILKKEKFDCIILDINLPGKNGFNVCSDYRKYNVITPVLMLTAFDELDDKIQGFKCGTDDYLTKPFFIKELVIRVQTLIKRGINRKNQDENNAILVAGDLVVNTSAQKVFKKGVEISLTFREYQILHRLLVAKGEFVAKKELVKEIWGTSFDPNSNTIEVYINFLRKKIDKPFETDTIKTKIGFGYYLE